MVELRRDNVVRAVELIADNIGDGPVLVHCMAGKDRTGIVVALVQAAIGVPLASIVEEYARSDEPDPAAPGGDDRRPASRRPGRRQRAGADLDRAGGDDGAVRDARRGASRFAGGVASGDRGLRTRR